MILFLTGAFIGGMVTFCAMYYWILWDVGNE
jgi:hypothetical protein